jgi:hypothetical protein
MAASSTAIQQLIDHLSTKIQRPTANTNFIARSDQIQLLRQQVRQPREDLATLTQSIRDTEKKMSQEKDIEARKLLKKERDDIRHRVSVKQQEVDKIVRRVNKLESENSAFLPTHPAKVQNHAVERLRREFQQWQRGELDFEPKSPIHRVYWELLKPSGDSWHEIVRHYEYLQRVRNERYELQRLKRIHDLGVDVIYVGLASFEGYVVFELKRFNCAVLDCPKVGNALYLMDADKWKFFTQLSKTELLDHHRTEVRRIIHGWGWFYELERELERRSFA